MRPTESIQISVDLSEDVMTPTVQALITVMGAHASGTAGQVLVRPAHPGRWTGSYGFWDAGEYHYYAVHGASVQQVLQDLRERIGA
jgi:hypothetical protein